MSEDDYCNLTDLQLLRAAKVMLSNVTASRSEDNYLRITAIRNNIQKMIQELEPKISQLLDSD